MAKKAATKDEWTEWWDARMAAMEEVLGKSADLVGHSMIPFGLGGAADVVYFKKHIDGVVCATSEMIGNDEQRKTKLGNYELMICHRKRDKKGQEWGASLISRLARYTCDAKLNPGDTMSIGPATPESSTIAAFLFCEYASFTVKRKKSGLLLCIGITDDELEACQNGKRSLVERKLKAAGVFPFTELFRKSVI